MVVSLKKLISLSFVVMMVLCMVMVSAYATEMPLTGAEIAPMSEATPFSWVALATVAGCAAATLLIVQFTKSLIPDSFPTRIYVYIVALLIMLAATHFTTGLTADSAILVVLNSFVAATSALGTYDLTFKAMDDKNRATE